MDKNTNILIVYLGVHKNFYGRTIKKRFYEWKIIICYFFYLSIYKSEKLENNINLKKKFNLKILYINVRIKNINCKIKYKGGEKIHIEKEDERKENGKNPYPVKPDGKAVVLKSEDKDEKK